MVDTCGYKKVRFGWTKLQASEDAGDSTLSDVQQHEAEEVVKIPESSRSSVNDTVDVSEVLELAEPRVK